MSIRLCLDKLTAAQVVNEFLHAKYCIHKFPKVEFILSGMNKYKVVQV